MSMYENVILYKSEYKTDENGHRIRFKTDKNGEYVHDKNNELIPDRNGQYFRQWRDHINSPNDIWDEIVKATKVPGVTSFSQIELSESLICSWILTDKRLAVMD